MPLMCFQKETTLYQICDCSASSNLRWKYLKKDLFKEESASSLLLENVLWLIKAIEQPTGETKWMDALRDGPIGLGVTIHPIFRKLTKGNRMNGNNQLSSRWKQFPHIF